MKGKVKVESFSTAGAEHLRREWVFRRKGFFAEKVSSKSPRSSKVQPVQG